MTAAVAVTGMSFGEFKGLKIWKSFVGGPYFSRKKATKQQKNTKNKQKTQKQQQQQQPNNNQKHFIDIF